AVGQASHEMLLGTRNAVYLCALQEITEVRAVAATYQRQAMQLYKDLTDARDAYTRLLAQSKAAQCQPSPEQDPTQQQRTVAPGPEPSSSVSSLVLSPPISSLVQPTSVSSFCPVPSVSSHLSVLSSAQLASGSSHDQPQSTSSVSSHVQPRGQSAPGLSDPASTSVNAEGVVSAAPNPPQYFYGPVALPGGFRIIRHSGPWLTTPNNRPSDLPSEVFWHKRDWFGKGYSNGTFIVDRNGQHLKHLMKGIRKMARRIWTELANRPGCWIATSFNKNGMKFLGDYVATIEEIYPCLKLCHGHWKARQLGISAYSHWFKNRSKYLDGTVGV
ncbi:hypothetical protein AN958_11902, partial [Leucoagaricus sp. SymC.cos]